MKERHFIKEDKDSNACIITELNNEAATVEISEFDEHIHLSFLVNTEEQKEAAMRALSIMSKDIEALRQEIIKKQ